MKLSRLFLLAVGLAITLGFASRYSSRAIAEDAPGAEKREGEPAGPPKGPPQERKPNPDGQGPRFTPPVEGEGLRRGPDGQDNDRFRPGRPVPNTNPGQGPRRNPGDPNPANPNPGNFEGRPEGRRPGVPGGPGFNGRGPGDFEQLKETDPEMFELMQADMKLDQQTRDEAEEYRRAKPSEKEAIKTKLAKSVQEHYDVRQKRRELELRRLEEQLTRLRDSVKKRVDEKDVMIKQRMSQLLGNPDDGF